MLRSSLHLIMAALFTIGALAASIFSSYVVSTSDLDVLVDSPFCGPIPMSDNIASAIRTYIPAIRSVTDAYARDCYRNESTLPALCNTFIQANIPFSTDRVPCPFNASMCKLREGSPAVSLDSGLVDVKRTFRLNIADKDNLRYRKKTTCTILPLDGFTRVVNASDYHAVFPRPVMPQEQGILFYYGRTSNPALKNATFFVSETVSNVSSMYLLPAPAIRYSSPAWVPYGNYKPLPELNRTDGDVILKSVFTGRIGSFKPVDDPFFSAHKPFVFLDATMLTNKTAYLPDFPASTMGCLEQYQFCLGGGTSKTPCTELSGLPSLNTSHYFPQATSLQATLMQLFITASSFMDISSTTTLNATSMLTPDGFLPSLPDNQWITELKDWESYVWATLQTFITDYAIGPRVRDPYADAYVVAPRTEAERALCGMQKMRKSGGFVNINVFGLAFIITIAVVVVVLDITLLKFLIFLSKFRYGSRLSPRLNRWIQDGVLQLQRRAYESASGVHGRHWIDLDKDIPLTTTDARFSDLPLESAPQSSEINDTTPNAENEKARSIHIEVAEPSRKSTETRKDDRENEGAKSRLSAIDVAPVITNDYIPAQMSKTDHRLPNNRNARVNSNDLSCGGLAARYIR